MQGLMGSTSCSFAIVLFLAACSGGAGDLAKPASLTPTDNQLSRLSGPDAYNDFEAEAITRWYADLMASDKALGPPNQPDTSLSIVDNGGVGRGLQNDLDATSSEDTGITLLRIDQDQAKADKVVILNADLYCATDLPRADRKGCTVQEIAPNPFFASPYDQLGAFLPPPNDAWSVVVSTNMTVEKQVKMTISELDLETPIFGSSPEFLAHIWHVTVPANGVPVQPPEIAASVERNGDPGLPNIPVQKSLGNAEVITWVAGSNAIGGTAEAASSPASWKALSPKQLRKLGDLITPGVKKVGKMTAVQPKLVRALP